MLRHLAASSHATVVAPRCEILVEEWNSVELRVRGVDWVIKQILGRHDAAAGVVKFVSPHILRLAGVTRVHGWSVSWSNLCISMPRAPGDVERCVVIRVHVTIKIIKTLGSAAVSD